MDQQNDTTAYAAQQNAQQATYTPNEQPVNPNYNGPEFLSSDITNTTAPYPHKNTDVTMFKVAFAFQIVSAVGFALLIIPLAWMIPMAVIGYKMNKGEKANTVAWGVCNLLFVNLVSGILYLIADKDEKLV